LKRKTFKIKVARVRRKQHFRANAAIPAYCWALNSGQLWHSDFKLPVPTNWPTSYTPRIIITRWSNYEPWLPGRRCKREVHVGWSRVARPRRGVVYTSAPWGLADPRPSASGRHLTSPCICGQCNFSSRFNFICSFSSGIRFWNSFRFCFFLFLAQL
jgi:hypothetical protein